MRRSDATAARPAYLHIGLAFRAVQSAGLGHLKRIIRVLRLQRVQDEHGSRSGLARVLDLRRERAGAPVHRGEGTGRKSGRLLRCLAQQGFRGPPQGEGRRKLALVLSRSV